MHALLKGYAHSVINRVENLAEMAAVGLGLSRETFREAGRYG